MTYWKAFALGIMVGLMAAYWLARYQFSLSSHLVGGQNGTQEAANGVRAAI